MEERIIIVNEEDEPIGVKERSLITSGDIYRVSALWIENNQGDCLLTRRAYTKIHEPGKWHPAVSGTVAEGETYEANVKKEAWEEIGLTDFAPTLGPKRRYSGENNFFAQWFTVKMNLPLNRFKFDLVEVAEARWFPRVELSCLVRERPDEFVKSASTWPELFGI